MSGVKGKGTIIYRRSITSVRYTIITITNITMRNMGDTTTEGLNARGVGKNKKKDKPPIGINLKFFSVTSVYKIERRSLLRAKGAIYIIKVKAQHTIMYDT